MSSITIQKPRHSANQMHKSEIRLTVAFIDWDDTLCPTSHLFRNKFPELDVDHTKLHSFGRSVYGFLLRCIALLGNGHIYIVTNGSQYWVQQSLAMLSARYQHAKKKTQSQDAEKDNKAHNERDYFVAIYELLQHEKNTDGIRVISARHYFQSFYCHAEQHADDRTSQQAETKASSGQRQRERERDTIQWKLFTFNSILNGYFHTNHWHKHTSDVSLQLRLLSIGDSDDEFHASMASKQWIQYWFSKRCQLILCHRIKLKAVPSIDGMMQQISCLSSLVRSLNAEEARKDVVVSFDDNGEVEGKRPKQV